MPGHGGPGISRSVILGGMEHDEFLVLAERLRAAADAYYFGVGTQLMDDAAYDAGVRELRDAAAAHGLPPLPLSHPYDILIDTSPPEQPGINIG